MATDTFHDDSVAEQSTCNAGAAGDAVSNATSRRSPGGVCGNLLRYSLVFSGKSHGQRSLTGYSPKGHRESDMSEDTNIGQLANIVR